MVWYLLFRVVWAVATCLQDVDFAAHGPGTILVVLLKTNPHVSHRCKDRINRMAVDLIDVLR